MTPLKFRQRLAGQTAIAQKVFEHVPVQEAWTAQVIYQAAHRAAGMSMDFRVFQDCLKALEDAGLIRAEALGAYQRDPLPIVKTVQPQQPKEKAEVTATAARPVIAKPAPSKPSSAIDALAGPLARLAAVVAEIKGIVSDLETAALAIDERGQEHDGEVQKLRQLKTLLKELG